MQKDFEDFELDFEVKTPTLKERLKFLSFLQKKSIDVKSRVKTSENKTK